MKLQWKNKTDFVLRYDISSSFYAENFAAKCLRAFEGDGPATLVKGKTSEQKFAFSRSDNFCSCLLFLIGSWYM